MLHGIERFFDEGRELLERADAGIDGTLERAQMHFVMVARIENGYFGIAKQLAALPPKPGQDQQLADVLRKRAQCNAAQSARVGNVGVLVASGLDSARRGEPEIRSQVRAAWQAARRAGTSGPILDRMFADALKTASEVQGVFTSAFPIHSPLAERRA